MKTLKSTKLLVFISLLPLFVMGQEQAPAKPNITDKVQGVLEEVKEDVKRAHDDATKSSEIQRQQYRYFGGLEWAPLDLLIPGKFGAHMGYNADANRSYELEYIRGSLSVPFIIDDLGSLVDDRISFNVRQFSGGTFNFFYGLDYIRFRLKLGNDLLGRLNPGVPSEVNVLELASLGAHVGLGNRWALRKNVMFGVDWVAWTQPLYRTVRKDPFLTYASDANDKDNVRDTLRIVEYFPRFTILRLSLGASF